MEGLNAAAHDQRLGPLLKRCRLRISASRESLGSFERLPARIGKPVTQEEVAEAVGISRQWYAMLELGRPTRVSAALLGRVASALIMDDPERALLFQLAVPELRDVPLTDRASSMVEAFASVRALVRRLRSATTQEEVLAIARDHARSLVAADTVHPKGHEFTELEREQLGAVAELTSLAIAGASPL
jgi:transcriptional regulator with XRE-family HTH domain